MLLLKIYESHHQQLAHAYKVMGGTFKKQLTQPRNVAVAIFRITTGHD